MSCCVYSCKSRSENRDREPGIAFYRFPPLRRDLWTDVINTINGKDWKPGKNVRICSKHFEERFFAKAGDRRYLVDDAVPTLFQKKKIEPSSDIDLAQAEEEAVDDLIVVDPLKLILKGIKTTKNVDVDDLAIEKICRGCLNVTDVKNIKDIFLDEISSITLYEDIIRSRVFPRFGRKLPLLTEWLIIPTVMCENCIKELKRVNKFVKLLKHSYLSLETAYHEIKQLEEQKDLLSNFDALKNSILRNVIKGRLQADAEEDDSTSKEGYMSDGSNVEVENISVYYESDSSDEEAVSIQCKVTLKNNEKAQINKICVQKENLPINNSIEKSKTSLCKEEERICPICSTKIRDFKEHLQSDHNLDWAESKCLKCLYHNKNQDKLFEHSKLCGGIVLKIEESQYEDPEEMNVDWTEFVNENGDIEFEVDECEREESDHSEAEEETSEDVKVEPRKYRKRKKKNNNFTCNKCEDAIFTNFADIESHIKVVHAEETNCILCKEEFNNSFTLLHHVITKHGKLKCCKLCLVTFNSSRELTAHYKSKEHNTKCSVCKVKFKNKRALYEHRRKKHLNPHLKHKKYKCPECPKEFANQNNRRRHIRVAHNDLRFLCDVCGQSYASNENLKFHILRFHEGVKVAKKDNTKKFVCETCGWKSNVSRNYAILKHQAGHIGHNYVCKICHDSFATEKEFNKHVEDLGHQTFKCDKCRAEFVNQYSYKVHLKNHDAPGWNKNLFPRWTKDATLRNEKGEYVCSYCSRICKDRFRLEDHIRVHTNERPFKCPVCSKAFKTWIHRKTHMDIHLGIKKWVCKYCKKAFTHSTTLRGHEMTHTGERPHKCPECDKGFITTSALKKHRVTHFRISSSKHEEKQNNDENTDEETIESENEEVIEYVYEYGEGLVGSVSDICIEHFEETNQNSE